MIPLRFDSANDFASPDLWSKTHGESGLNVSIEEENKENFSIKVWKLEQCAPVTFYRINCQKGLQNDIFKGN